MPVIYAESELCVVSGFNQTSIVRLKADATYSQCPSRRSPAESADSNHSVRLTSRDRPATV